MTRLSNWRALVVYTHRWLGIAGCVLFIAWFASGIVLMYARMPSLSAEERLARIGPLDLTTLQVEPAAAVATAGFSPTSIRVGMLGSRPVYRLHSHSRWAAVYADTGEAVDLDTEVASTVARAFVPEHASSLRYDAHLTESDQWTLSSALRPLMPLHRFALADAADTRLYISARTGEPVMKTTRRERVWGYLGAVTHWLYFTPLRRNTGLWIDVVVWLSLLGCVMCLSGLVWGLWRFSPTGRFRLKRQSSHTPYAGLMKWHHYAGLVFGVTTCTWIFSGLMSMTPWDWSPGHSPTPAQREAVAGGPFDANAVTVERIRRASDAVQGVFAAKEMEIAQFGGEPFVTAYRPPREIYQPTWQNTDLPAFVEPSTLEHVSVSLVAPERGPFERFSPQAVEEAASRALAPTRMARLAWLGAYDNYYYDRTGSSPLPVLRAEYDDDVDTWLYFDPFKGAVVQKEERRSRWERWLYHGLHSLDLPGFYEKRPLWDIVLIILSVGGLASSATAVWPAWRRIVGHVRRRSNTSRRPRGSMG